MKYAAVFSFRFEVLLIALTLTAATCLSQKYPVITSGAVATSGGIWSKNVEFVGNLLVSGNGEETPEVIKVETPEHLTHPRQTCMFYLSTKNDTFARRE